MGKLGSKPQSGLDSKSPRGLGGQDCPGLTTGAPWSCDRPSSCSLGPKHDISEPQKQLLWLVLFFEINRLSWN